MRNVLVLLLLFFPALAPDRQLTLARDMVEEAVIRGDEEQLQLARERLVRIASETSDRTVMRDANYLAALAALFESNSPYRDRLTAARAGASGTHLIDRALELDPKFADAWAVSAMLGRRNDLAKAIELDPKSTPAAFFAAFMKSFNPNGGAPPEGVKAFDDLAARLDADRAATGRAFGLWDAEAHAWQIFVRIASDEPDAATMRPMVARLLEQRPDFALARMLGEAVAERRFVEAPAMTWQPFLTDAAGDGKNPKLPDIVAVDKAESGDRIWYRVTFHDPLPRSFGVNVVINRSGDPATGSRWWGKDSTARFDRLITAWITHDGDRYFGRVGVTDDDGARGARMTKLSSDVQLAMTERSGMLGVPREVLGLTEKSSVIVAGGSPLVWNDDATSAANSR